MQSGLMIIIGLGLLYFTRKLLTRQLMRLVRRFAGDQPEPDSVQRAYIAIWSLIFLPGTIVHEVSHFFAAAFTGARTGKIEIFPTMIKPALGEKDKTKFTRLGSMQIQKLGAVRGFIVGVAPLAVGLGILVWISSTLKLQVTNYKLPDILKLYFFFTVANSLFPSWTDIKYALPLLIIGVIAGIGMWYFGFSIAISSQSPVVAILKPLSDALLISAGINAVIIVLLAVTNRLVRRRIF